MRFKENNKIVVNMRKSTLLKKIQAMIDAQLFGGRPWPPDQATVAALQKKVFVLGLEERVPGMTDTWRSTPLGNEIQLDLMMVFMGIWALAEIPDILGKHQLIDEAECKSIYDKLEDGQDAEGLIIPLVQRAYFKHFNPSKLLN